MKSGHSSWLKRVSALFEIPAPDQARLLRRIEVMERDIMLPVKAAVIGILFHSFKWEPWIGLTSSSLDVMVETVQLFFWFYVLANILFGAVLFAARRLPLAVVQWSVVTSGLVDALLIAGLSLLTGGLDSILFWLFLVLVIRNSASVPPGFSQIALNFAVSLCYALVGVLDVSVISGLDSTTLHALDVSVHDNLGEPFALRMIVLFLTTICCYGAQLLLERQALAIAEALEFASRESQLRSAGRVAAEIAHQIKNPLAIINNAAFSLKRSLQENKNSAAQQIEIIQEEVAHADRVITQIMGYAQLTEGRVEKLDIIKELERALLRVFPPAVPGKIKIYRDYESHFPPLLMQRGHLSEIFINLLQNAREALGESGSIFITAENRRDYSIEITLRDNGPGIPQEKMERIFEAYYSTKEKGSGLGLSIVKHNLELYGGKIQVDSEIGIGTRFAVTFPAKAIVNL